MAPLSFQLIFSDGGGGGGGEAFWELCPIALVPYALNIPPEQVQLLVAPKLLNTNEEVIATAERVINENQIEGVVEYLPKDYFTYLKRVYGKSTPVSDKSLQVECDVRIISGYGFSGVDGGGIRLGRSTVTFQSIQPVASVLTVLDIGNAAFAVASFTDTYPSRSPSQFTPNYKKTTVLVDPPMLPIACDATNLRMAFRVGTDGQHLGPQFELEEDLPTMSVPLGNAVSACLLASVWDYVQGGRKGSLNKVFLHKYTHNLKLQYAPKGHTLKPYCDLSKLEALLDKEHVRIHEEAFHCELFQRQSEWFLTTTERPAKLHESQEAVAQEMVAFLVAWVQQQWHRSNPIHAGTPPPQNTPMVWKKISQMMGPFEYMLRHVYLEQDENSQLFVSTEDDGVELEVFALSCTGFEECLNKVLLKVETGSFEYDTGF